MLVVGHLGKVLGQQSGAEPSWLLGVPVLGCVRCPLTLDQATRVCATRVGGLVNSNSDDALGLGPLVQGLGMTG